MPRLPVMAAYSVCAWVSWLWAVCDLLLELLNLLDQLHDGGDINDRELRVRGPDAAEARARRERERCSNISGT